MSPPNLRVADPSFAAPHRVVARLLDRLPLARCSGLLWPVKPLVAGDAMLARDIYRNRFLLAGIEVSGGTGSIFAETPPNSAWAAELHGFAWLAHLEAGAGEMYRAAARGLVSDWIARHSNHPREASFAGVRAARLGNIAKAAPFLLQGSGQTFREPFLRQMARQAASLAKDHAGPAGRLPIAMALVHAVTVFDGLAAIRAHAWERLEHELGRDILPDGGHASRDPAALARLLLELLPLRSALSEGRQPIPKKFNAAIERMLPMARFFCHGDEGLAIFQGAASPMIREMRALLEADQTRGRPLTLAPHAGYCRLAQGQALVIADAGADKLCSGPLAFEFSDGAHRIVVNCGLPPGGAPDWSHAACGVSAHSTADFERDCAAAGIARFLPWLKPAPHPAERTASHQASPLGALFRGRNHMADVDHARDLFLAASGGDLRGEDRLASQPGAAPLTFALRFHLHPAVKATVSKDGASITLMLPNKSGWRFSSRGAAMTLEDSVYLAGQPEPRRSHQIVLRGIADPAAKVNWAFKRLEKRASKGAEDKPAPELPF